MARKPKTEIQNDLIKKERLRAKELTLSDEYRQDISQYEQLEKEMSDWRVVQRALISPNLKPSFTKKELYEHMEKGRRLRRDLDASCEAILTKYKITYPFSIDNLKAIAGPEEPKGRIRANEEIPVRVLPSDDGISRERRHNNHVVYLDAEECFSVKINPRGSKKDILHYISMMLDTCAEHGIKSAARFRNERIRDLEVYRLRAIGKIEKFPVYKGREKTPREYRLKVSKKTFTEIAKETNINADAARKAYNRVYKWIHGTQKGMTKTEVKRAYLKKECSTCTDKICIKTKKICPDILSYAEQDHGKQREDQYYGLINKLER